MILILIIAAFTIGAFLLNLNYQYWVKRGVPGPKPRFLVGNLIDNFLFKKSLADVYGEIYEKFEDVPLVGIFRAGTPTLIIRDPELIKEITVKSFQNFHDNDLYIDKNVDPIWGRNPFFLRGEGWKETRVHLTPGFTTGKMKYVYPLLEDVSKKLVKYIQNHPTATNGQGCSAKEVCMRFTLNNVGSCAFGLDAKCFDEENPEFKQIADKFLSPGGWVNMKIFLISIVPILTKFVSIKLISKDIQEKLTDVITQALKYRQQNNIIRNDMLNILAQVAMKNEDFTDIDITAHAAGFFVDGYETSSITMHFLLYELASNPEAQSKLRDEINKSFKENENTLPYEEILKMSYLEAVFNEGLRLHPPLGSLNKVCTKPYTYTPKENDAIKTSFVIEPKTPVILPLYALHRDEKYFDEPNSFKPERFLEPNKSSIPKYAFLPFGDGPRACLGKRFGSLQVKIGTAYIVKNFEISVNKKTKLPIEHDATYFLTMPKESLWLDFKKID